MLTTTDAADYHRQGFLPGKRHLSVDEATSLRDACIESCGVEIKDTPRRQANNRLKPYLLFPWAAALVRHLAGLAWATDLPQKRIRTIPRRYDFGPDPYARYRTP